MFDYLDASNYTELKLFECGREKCIPDKNFEFTTKNFHMFHYVVSGKGIFSLDNVNYELKKGNVFYIPPNAQPRYYPDKLNPWTYIWIGFDGSLVEHYLFKCGLVRSSPVFTDYKDSRLYGLFNEISNHYLSTRVLNINCLGLMYQIFYEMITLTPGETNKLPIKEGHIKEAKEFIAYNYQFKITVKDIADSLGLTSNYLANIFNEVLNTSPKQYLTQYRIIQACSLLKKGERKIKDVGLRVGYLDQLHFSVEFKKIMNMSPSQYAKQI